MSNKDFVIKIAELAKFDKDRCQSQESIAEQLRLLVYIGNAVGLYDAVCCEQTLRSPSQNPRQVGACT